MSWQSGTPQDCSEPVTCVLHSIRTTRVMSQLLSQVLWQQKPCHDCSVRYCENQSHAFLLYVHDSVTPISDVSNNDIVMFDVQELSHRIIYSIRNYQKYSTNYVGPHIEHNNVWNSFVEKNVRFSFTVTTSIDNTQATYINDFISSTTYSTRCETSILLKLCFYIIATRDLFSDTEGHW